MDSKFQLTSKLYLAALLTVFISKLSVAATPPTTSDAISGQQTCTEPTLDQVRQDVLGAHNAKRSAHHAPPLRLNDTLNAYAQQFAESLATNHKFDGDSYSQSSYWSTYPNFTGAAAVDKWYNQKGFYDYNRPGYYATTGGFTQVVWKSTTDLGVGYVKVSNPNYCSYYVTTAYSPGGNYAGQFEENVQRPSRLLNVLRMKN